MRRPDVLARRIEYAYVDPHSAKERFDPGFMMALHCQACGKIGTAERRVVSEAVRDHAESCPKRHTVKSVVVRVTYPKQ